MGIDMPSLDDVSVVRVRPESSNWTKIAKAFLALAFLVGMLGLLIYARDASQSARRNGDQIACRAVYNAKVASANAAVQATTSQIVTASIAGNRTEIAHLGGVLKVQALALRDATVAYQASLGRCRADG